MKNSVAVVKSYDDPLPANVHDLDMITYLFFYHDTTYLNVDRAQTNRKLFEVLKPGGTLVIADHSAKAGSDPSVGKTLHRIDESMLRREVEAAGFKLVAEGNFWRNPGDPRDFSTQQRSEEHTSELQSPDHLVCRLLLEKKITIQLQQLNLLVIFFIIILAYQ